MAAAGLTPALVEAAAGCPSGLAPPLDPETEGAADPTAFVRREAAGACRLELMVAGARCAGCIKKIEGGLLAEPDVSDARLNLSTGRLTIAWVGAPARARAFVASLKRLGYQARAFDPEAGRAAEDAEGRALLRRLAVAGFAAMNVMMFSIPVWAGHGEMGPGVRALLHWFSAILVFPAAIYAAQPFFRSAWGALRAGQANMDVPISLGVVLTLGMSLYETALGGGHAYFDGVAMLLFLLLIGRYLDHRLRERARSAARDLLALQAVTASRVNPDGTLTAVAAKEIAVGDVLSLAPGDRAPVDGVVEAGASELDRAILTGETAPHPVRAGDAIPAGAVNLTRALTLRASRRVEDSTVAELARLIELGEQGRARHMRIVDRAARLYVPVVHSLAALTFLFWWLAPQFGLALEGAGLRTAFTNAAAVLIITCPCALGLAVPAVQIVATGRLFKRGVFVKSGDALERLARIDHVVLDKTGTLTLGRPELLTPLPPETLALAASLARVSRHPLSRALVEAAGPGAPAAGVIEHPGRGLEAEIEGQSVRLGSKAFVAPGAAAQSHAGEELWLAIGEGAPLQLLFRDALRSDAAAAVAGLQARGLSAELLSGDRREAVAAAAAAAGLSVFRGEVDPKGKVARLEALRAAGRRPLMVGDGLNDTAALAAASASASPGTAIGASQAAADLVFQGALLAPVLEAIDVARAARRRVFENLGFSALYNFLAVPIAVLGLVTPLIAAVAMSASSLIVTLNALRLAGSKGGQRWTS